MEFVKEFMNLTYVKRTGGHIELDPKTIHSGDIFLDTSFIGLSSIIKVGTGSRSSHV